MRKFAWLLCGACLVMSSFGCRGTDTAPILAPGTTKVQRERAQVFDPYPQTAVGPDVDGGRPREYMQPPAEPTRARWVKWLNW